MREKKRPDRGLPDAEAVKTPDELVSAIASAIGEPPRTRILFSLLDGQARTSTELSLIADVSPSTTSVHLERLRKVRLVKVVTRGKHRFYSLLSTDVVRALEGLVVLAGTLRSTPTNTTDVRVRVARICYDHLAGRLGVDLHDKLRAMRWLTVNGNEAYVLTPEGTESLARLGVDVDSLRLSRRHLASSCLDWSERRPHLAGALGAALLNLALKREWVTRDPDRKALEVTPLGRRELLFLFGVRI